MTDDPTARRVEAARQAVRAVGAVLRAYRLYSAGHASTQQVLRDAQNALRAYASAYGSLRCSVDPQGIVFDFSAQPLDDDVLAELRRGLAATKITSITFLPGATADQIAALVETLRLPRQALERGGGASRLLRERGVHAIALDAVPSAALRFEAEDLLLQALQTAPQQLAARLDEVGGKDPGMAARTLANMDRAVDTWPPEERDQAWTQLATAITATAPPLRTSLCAAIYEARAEPWAASLASRWPPTLIAGLLAGQAGSPSAPAEVIAASLRDLHRGVPTVRPPDVGPPDPATLTAAREAVLAIGDAVLSPYAVARFLIVLARVEAAAFADGLRLVERGTVAAVEAEDIHTVARVLIGLAVLAKRLGDARGELARLTLHHLLTTAVRDLVAKTGASIADEHHPLREAFAAAPEEAVLLLLDLLADEERLPVRRQIVALLSVLSRGRLPMLALHLVDPRWYVARNVATTMGQMRDPAAIPYLKSALQHQDIRVRKEALAALSAVGTPEAIHALAEAQRHSDPATREAATHWLKAVGQPRTLP